MSRAITDRDKSAGPAVDSAAVLDRVPATADSGSPPSGLPADLDLLGAAGLSNGDDIIDMSPADFTSTASRLTVKDFLLRAAELERDGHHRLAIKYFLYVLDTHASSLSLDQIIFALRRLSAICAYHKKFDEALRFRNAERLVYESQILTIDVLEQPVAGAVDAAAGSLRPETDAVACAALKRDVHRAQQYERLARMFFESGNKPMAGEYTRHAIAARRGIAARYGVGELGDITPAMVRAATAVEEGASDYDQAVRRYVLKQRKTAAARPAAAAGDGDHDDEEEEEEHENGDGDGAVSLADAEGAGIVASLFAGDPTRPLLPVIDIFGVTAPSADADTYSASTTTAASGAAGGGEAAFGRAINSLAAGLSSDLAALERLDRERRLKEEAMRMDAAGNVLSVSAKDDILTALHRRGALSAAAAAVPTTTAVTADGNDSDGDEIDDLDDLLRDLRIPSSKRRASAKRQTRGPPAPLNSALVLAQALARPRRLPLERRRLLRLRVHHWPRHGSGRAWRSWSGAGTPPTSSPR